MLLERDIELKTIDRGLSRAQAGDGGVVVLEGPSGIGKTAVLGAAAEHASSRGFEVLHARASELERELAFGIARQLLERRVGAATPRERRALLTGVARDAAPALGMPGRNVAGGAGSRSLHGLYWLVTHLTRQTPSMLCVDDAQWADRSSLRWLAYSARRLAGLRLLIVVAAHPREPGAERDLLDALSLDDASHVLHLAPLSRESVTVLVDAALPGATRELAAACHRCTGGNPLLVRELLRELPTRATGPKAVRAGTVPDFGVDAAARGIREQLHGMGTIANAVARAVAVLGDGSTVMDATALCDADEAAVRAAAASLAAANVLQPGAQLAFAHPLVRTAVYRDTAEADRATLHRAAAGALASGEDDPERAALHLLRVEPQGESQVVDVLMAAAAAAAERGAPDAAATLLRRALAEPPSPGEPRAAVLLALGKAEAAARLEGFEEHLRRAIDEIADREEAAEVRLVLGRALVAFGDFERAFDAIEQARRAVDPRSSIGLALEGELLALSQAHAPLRQRAGTRIDAHLDRLRRGGHTEPAALGALAACLLRDHPPASRAVQAAEAALADDRLRSAEVSATTLSLVGSALVGAGQLSRAGKIVDGAATEAWRRGDALTLMWASYLRSEVAYREGNVVKAESEARFGWDIATGDTGGLPPAPLGLAVGAAMLVNALTTRGELGEAERYLDRVRMLPPVRSELLLTARAELRLAQGHPQDAIADLRAVGELLGDGFHKPVQNWRARLAVALASSGDFVEAQTLAAAELEQARAFDVPLAIGVALTTAGVVEGGSDGIALLEEAVAVLEQTEGRLDHAVAAIELGALLRRSGSRTAAREALRAGLDLAARCGAAAHADRAHAELMATGSQPRRDRRVLAGPESLTAGEYQVAAKVANGLTDREIAQRLYVSESTVQHHLRNAFRKLDVSAHGYLAAALSIDSPPSPNRPRRGAHHLVPAFEGAFSTQPGRFNDE